MLVIGIAVALIVTWIVGVATGYVLRVRRNAEPPPVIDISTAYRAKRRNKEP